MASQGYSILLTGWLIGSEAPGDGHEKSPLAKMSLAGLAGRKLMGIDVRTAVQLSRLESPTEKFAIQSY